MKLRFRKFEDWLRIDQLAITSDKLRARAIYMIALILVISQLVNMGLMAYSYGGWTADHWISLAVSTFILGSILALRYTKKFYLFAGFYSILMVLAILGTAMDGYTGINSALLPFTLFGSVVCGFVSGWRIVLAYGAMLGVTVHILYSVSIGAPTGALYDPSLFAARNFQRASQMYLALGLITAVTSYASYAMHSAFFKLEQNADIAVQANREKTQFMANISHELRTPLNGVLGMSGLLLKTKQQPQQREYTEIVNQCAQNLFAIIEDVLDITKIDADNFILKPEPFNLSVLLRSIVDLNKPEAKDKGIAIGLRVADDLPKRFIGDKKAIRQVVSNLMRNAVSFTEKGSVFIRVEGQLEENNKCLLQISVKDTGIGIAPKNMKKIFERFSQLDVRLSRKQEGTGLGLAISKQISELMGGKLTVLTRLGEGATFTFEVALPVQEDRERTMPDVAVFLPVEGGIVPGFEEIIPYGEERQSGGEERAFG